MIREIKKLKQGESFAPGEIGKKHISEMVGKYRKAISIPKRLKYAHFEIKDVLEVFSKNGVLPEAVTKVINENINHISKYGLKIYLGKHVNEQTFPRDINDKPNSIYKNRITTILVNTDIEKKPRIKKGFEDILADGKVLLIGAAKDGGVGLDRAEIEPPYHEEDGEGSGYYDIGEEEEA